MASYFNTHHCWFFIADTNGNDDVKWFLTMLLVFFHKHNIGKGTSDTAEFNLSQTIKKSTEFYLGEFR